MNPTPERTEGGMPRLLRSTHVTPWADRHAIYPADAARSAFEDAATSEYAKEYWAAKLNQALAQNDALRGALKDAITRINRACELMGTIRAETRPVAGHEDPGAIEDCWREAFDELVQAEDELNKLTTTSPAKA